MIVVKRFPLFAGPADTVGPVLRPFLAQTPIDALQHFHSLHIPTGDCAIYKGWVTADRDGKKGVELSVCHAG